MTTAAQPGKPETAGTFDGRYIFLAEDDIDDQELLIEAISHAKPVLPVRTTTNGKKAALFLQALPHSQMPSLIILDFNLPEVDGGQLLRILSHTEQFEGVPKLVWSTSNSPIFRQICMDLGARAYFVKPHDLRGFREMAEEMLAFID